MDKRIRKKDYVIMLVMTVVYSVIAFINLGSLSAPVNGYIADETGQSVMVFFEEKADLSRVTYYCGAAGDWYGVGRLEVEYVDGNNRFADLCTLDNPDNTIFKWLFRDVETTTSAVRLTAEQYYDSEKNISGIKGEFLEVAFYSKNSDMPVPIERIEFLDENSAGMARLFDEQEEAVYEPSFMNSTYFDEVYFPRTAYEYMVRINPYENTHPPLGKIMILLSYKIFGVNAFGWRFMGTLFGIFMIPLMYIFGKKVFGDSFLAFCCAFLMMFDFMHFVQTRIGTVDGYLVFFIIMMFYHMNEYFMRKSYDLRFMPSLKPLLLCGIFFGLGISVKWIGLYAGLGLAFMFFTSRILEYIDYRRGKVDVKGFRLKYIWGTMAMCLLFFIVIPLAIYSLSYIPVFRAIDSSDWLKDLLGSQKHMFVYHSGVTQTHPYASTWWQWPFMVRPVYYYLAPVLEEGQWGSIASFGNPAVWWGGLVAFFWTAWLAFKNKDKGAVFIFAGYLSILLPWAFSPRKITFLYHYFACVPFLIFAIVYVMRHLLENNKRARTGIYIFLGLVMLLFIVFYPSLTGIKVPEWYTKSLRWLPSWFF
ncbi:MAG: phospholipid carrier-dependent glycosyltransferase [Clostridia bacterium]|nr:phospholipid carrier-dependent glycosyltransferase [Clostridia bacterium]